MEIATIVELITTLGFPIALCVFLFWFIWQIYKKSEEREDKLMERIKECREINKQAIETIALYADRLTRIETNVDEIKGDVATIKDKL